MVKETLREKIKIALSIFLNKLEDLVEGGYLSPRVWGGVLIISLVGLIIFAQYRPASSTDAAVSEQWPAPLETPQPSVASLSFESLTDAASTAEAEVVALESAPTPTVEASPLPTATPPFTLHTVQEGESLISIAALYNLTTETLLATNDIRDPDALKPGQHLLIPPPEGVRIPIVIHEIQAGDDLLFIAAQYGSSMKDILTANPGVALGELPVGDRLIVPIIFNQPTPSPRSDTDEAVYYTVQPGDIPLTIAAQFEVPVEILLSANGISDPTLLPIGYELVIPSAEGITLGFPVILHELVEGNTLLNIAVRYGSSVKDILAINPNLIPSDLKPGLLVAVPIIFSPPKPTPAPDIPTPVPIDPSGPQGDLQQQMLAAINAQRAANGLPPYQLDEQVAVVAIAHAQDMVRRSYLAHVNPEGQSVRDRVVAGGIGNAGSVGENIQSNTRPRDQTVSEALNWFLNSGPHRRGLLNANYNRIGIGIINGPPEWFTFVLVFVER